MNCATEKTHILIRNVMPLLDQSVLSRYTICSHPSHDDSFDRYARTAASAMSSDHRCCDTGTHLGCAFECLSSVPRLRGALSNAFSSGCGTRVARRSGRHGTLRGRLGAPRTLLGNNGSEMLQPLAFLGH